jgi:hypothetical protein
MAGSPVPERMQTAVRVTENQRADVREVERRKAQGQLEILGLVTICWECSLPREPVGGRRHRMDLNTYGIAGSHLHSQLSTSSLLDVAHSGG